MDPAIANAVTPSDSTSRPPLMASPRAALPEGTTPMHTSALTRARAFVSASLLLLFTAQPFAADFVRLASFNIAKVLVSNQLDLIAISPAGSPSYFSEVTPVSGDERCAVIYRSPLIRGNGTVWLDQQKDPSNPSAGGIKLFRVPVGVAGSLSGWPGSSPKASRNPEKPGIWRSSHGAWSGLSCSRRPTRSGHTTLRSREAVLEHGACWFERGVSALVQKPSGRV